MALFVARTFLPPPCGGERWDSLLRCKGTKTALKTETDLILAIFAG